MVSSLYQVEYWSFSFNISPSNEHSGLISFKMDLLDLLAIQGTLKSLLQHHNSKASVLWHSAFCIVQLSHPYMTTGKTIALTRWTFVDKVLSLFFNMLSKLVAQRLNHLPAMWETWVGSLGWEDPRRRKCQPTPIFLPGKFHGQGSLAGYSLWCCKRQDLATNIYMCVFVQYICI